MVYHQPGESWNPEILGQLKEVRFIAPHLQSPEKKYRQQLCFRYFGDHPWHETIIFSIPSGKLTKNYGKIHHFQWEHPLFLWSFSIAMLVYQRVIRKGLTEDEASEGDVLMFFLAQAANDYQENYHLVS